MKAIADPQTPQYFLESFPREDFPRYLWTERPSGLPVQAWTTETTHRDGQQGGLPLTPEQGLQIYDLLCRFTGVSGAIRQAEFFVYRTADRLMLEGALERYRSGAPIEPTTWIRAAAKDVELIQSLGVRETGMLASASDYHTFHKFKPGGRNQAAKAYLEAVQMALDAGVRPRLHLEDATRAPLEFLLPLVENALELAEPYGLRPKFRVCDTMGLGLPYDDVALPRSIPRIFRELRKLGLEPEDLEFHPHNDTGLIVANCLAALREGCAVINGTTLGKGERTGNAPLEQILLHLIGMGYFESPSGLGPEGSAEAKSRRSVAATPPASGTPEASPGRLGFFGRPDFTVLGELAELYAAMGEPLPAKYPLYGKDAHRTRAGIHADGLNKFWWMYAPFDVPRLLGRPLEVSLTKESGLAGLIFLIRQHRGIELAKDDPGLQALHAWVVEQFEAGRQTAIEWEELEPKVKEYLGVPV